MSERETTLDRCPECHHQFGMFFGLQIPTTHCKHCNLWKCPYCGAMFKVRVYK